MAERSGTDARAEILARIRAALPHPRPDTAAEPEGPQPDLPGELDDPQARMARFGLVLQKVGGRMHRARDESAAARTIAGIVGELGAREVALSDDPLIRRLSGALPHSVRTFDGWTDRRRLFACDLGLSTAQWGVAETGTIVLESTAERHRLVSLVPPVHVAVLRLGSLLAGLGDALVAIRRGQDGAPARTITLITGPSRTADIELELVLGAHGPRALHVVVLS